MATTALPQLNSPLHLQVSNPDTTDFAFGPLSTIFGDEPLGHSDAHQSVPP